MPASTDLLSFLQVLFGLAAPTSAHGSRVTPLILLEEMVLRSTLCTVDVAGAL